MGGGVVVRKTSGEHDTNNRMGAATPLLLFDAHGGYTLALRANGNQVSVEVNGSTVIGPITDSTWTSGDAGLWSYTPSSVGSHRFDTFSITVLGGGQQRASKVLALRVLPQIALTPAPNQVFRLYYYAGGARVAVRVLTGASGANDLYFLHSDHLGSTSMTTDLSANVVGQQRYMAYGEPRNPSGTLHTDRRFTGQREETNLGSLYDFNARMYSPLIGRFVSADSIVPGAGNPQALNRYAFVLNNPLKYTDPSGHDVMIAGGNGADPYGNPIEYEAWIRAYKGWDAKQWANFYRAWMGGTNTIRSQLMQTTGVHFFSISSGKINDALLWKLADEMRGMKDVTLIGHSWGANLVMNYMARQGSMGGAPFVSQFITLKAPDSRAVSSVFGQDAGTTEPGSPFYPETKGFCGKGGCSTTNTGWRVLGPSDVTLVNIYGTLDIVSTSGYLPGAINLVSNDPQPYFGRAGQFTNHGVAPALAVDALLAVGAGNDHNSNMMAPPD